MIEHFIDARGVLLRRDVVKAQVDDHIITSAVRDGVLVRIRHGACCRSDVWESADRAERHRLRSHAVRRLYGDDVARSHVSALLEHGGPDWGLPMDQVHLTHLFGIGERTQSSIVHHRGAVLVNDLTRIDGSWVTSAARSALDTAALAGRDPAVCILDWVMASGLTTREELQAGIRQMERWPGTISLDLKLRLANGRCESVGESRCALSFRDHGLPEPICQLELFHPSGRLAARLDFAWPEHKVVVEFDGWVKYLRWRRENESIEECVVREKKREDMIRAMTGWIVVRVTWHDLERPAVLAAKIRSAFATAAA